MNDERTRIDDVIDRAVRDIMRRDPPAGFRARVLSRLDASPRRAPRWPALAAAAGALAVFAVAALVLREGPSQPPAAVPQVAERQPAAVPAAQPRTEPAASVPAAQRPARRATRAEPVRTATFGPRDGRISAATLAAPPTDRVAATSVPETDTEAPAPLPPSIIVPALPPPAPLEVAPIVVPPIQMPRARNPSGTPPR